jgi:hypothetical protein
VIDMDRNRIDKVLAMPFTPVSTDTSSLSHENTNH